MVKLQILGNEIISSPNDKVSAEKIKEFLDLLIDITNKNKATSDQIEDATKRVLNEIDFQGIDVSKYLSNIKKLNN